MRIKRLIAGFSASLLLALGMPASAFAVTTTVTPTNMQGWGFIQETAMGSGAMVSGPGAPPIGVGSANLIVNDTGGEALAKAGYQGLDLDDITKLQYSTYRTSGAPALAIALQFNIDADSTDTDNGFQGRLVYEPYHTQTVTTGSWQSWDALNDSTGTGTGNWFFSNGALAASTGCSMATPCTWAEVKAALPNAEIHSTIGAVYLKAGGGWTGGFNGNVDALSVNNDTYNFDPAVAPPSAAAQCRNGGWRTFNNPSFSSRDDCLDYVEDHNREVEGEIKYTAGNLKRSAEFEMNTEENRGTFKYSDANGDWYRVRISEVRVSGNTAYFAGEVRNASNPAWIGQWLFAKVEDGRPDKIWGDFTNETTARNGVINMTSPSSGPFNITRGDLEIED